MKTSYRFLASKMVQIDELRSGKVGIILNPDPAVIAMTGHKDYELADHYSKLDHEYQRDLSIKIMEEVEKKERVESEKPDNVIKLIKN